LKQFLERSAKRVLSWPPIATWPVRVRSGVAAGAKWSLFPYSAYWRGTHEPEAQRAVIELMDWTGKSVWDLGSHFGLFAIGLGRRVGPTGSVAAIEPFPENFARLELHIRRNHLNWVRPFQVAASDHHGRDRFLLYKNGASTTAHLLYEGETWDPSIPTITVELRALDELVDAGQLRLPDFVKIDVEGHGHKAIAGAMRAITASRPIILMGLHSLLEVSETEKLLVPLGYTFTGIKPNAPADKVGGDFLLRPGR
jgi:FkbM family methyltransferase